jgi:hypothetical protein
LFAVAFGVAAGGFSRTGEAADYWYNTVGPTDLENPLHFGQRTITISQPSSAYYLLTFADERYIEPDEPPGYIDNIVVAGITEFAVWDRNTSSYINYPMTNKTALVPVRYVLSIGNTDYLQCRASFDVTLETSGDLGVINWDPSYLKLP